MLKIARPFKVYHPVGRIVPDASGADWLSDDCTMAPDMPAGFILS